jgi:aminoglycoside phosphotransferase (APT) family kinase protein
VESRARGAVAGASAVRGEDSFDVGSMAQWLREHAEDGTSLAGIPEVRQFSGGASNLTYLLRYPSRDLILRRPPTGHKAKSAHDMGREHRIQKALRPLFPYVPEMVAFCGDESVIGSQFYVMERVEGTILRRDLPPELGLDEAHVRTLCTRVLDLLVELHGVDPSAVGLSDLGRGHGYVARQVAGWTQRYRAAKTWNVGSFEKVMHWLEVNQPNDVRTCLIHNDFRFDNIVLSSDDPTHPVGLLDWEMATLGDPLMDLGGALAYWVQADDGRRFRQFRRQPTHEPGMMTRREVVDYYTSRTGLSLTPQQWAFYEVFGLFRLAVIVQQIYYRYHHGQTHNPAFKRFHLAVLMLEARCRRIIRRAGR